MVGEGGGVRREPGGVVLAGDERAHRHARREHRVRQRGRVRAQGAAQLAQFAEEGQAEHLGEVPRGGLAAVGPHPDPLAGGVQEGGAKGPAVAASAQRGVDDELGGGRLHRVGVLQLPVSGEPARRR